MVKKQMFTGEVVVQNVPVKVQGFMRKLRDGTEKLVVVPDFNIVDPKAPGFSLNTFASWFPKKSTANPNEPSLVLAAINRDFIRGTWQDAMEKVGASIVDGKIIIDNPDAVVDALAESMSVQERIKKAEANAKLLELASEVSELVLKGSNATPEELRRGAQIAVEIGKLSLLLEKKSR